MIITTEERARKNGGEGGRMEARGVAGGSHGDALLRGRRSDIKKITHDEADSSFFFLLGSQRHKGKEPKWDKRANGLADPL